jgi:hypothetical protein
MKAPSLLSSHRFASAGNISPPYNAAAQTFAGRIPLEKSQTNGTSYATSPRTQLMMQMNTNPFLPPPYPMRSAAVCLLDVMQCDAMRWALCLQVSVQCGRG